MQYQPIAIDADALSGDIGGVAHEKQDSLRDIARIADTRHWRLGKHRRPLHVVGAGLGPQDGARGDGIDPDIRAELQGERACQHDEPGLGRRVHRVANEGLARVYVGDVDDAALCFFELWHGRLGEKQGRFQIDVQQLLVRRISYAAERCRKKLRGVIDENVQASERRGHRCEHLCNCSIVAEIRLEQLHAPGARSVQLVAQLPGIVQGAQIVQSDVHSLGVQAAHDLRTNSAGAAGYEGDLGWQRIGRVSHEWSRRVDANTGRL